MKIQLVCPVVLFFLATPSFCQLKDAPESVALHRLAGTWDIFNKGGKDIIGEFSASQLSKTDALQTRFKMRSSDTEVIGTWVYDPEIKAIVIFEVTSSGLVRSYQGNFREPDALWMEGHSKADPSVVTEKSSLTWIEPGKIRVWSNDLASKQEGVMIMVKRQ